MPSLRDIRTRIASVKSTRQITAAMKMVAAAKMRRAVENATNARPYQETLTATLQRVAASARDSEHPLLLARSQVRNVCIVVIGTDRGLCGGFNSNLNRKVDEYAKRLVAEGRTVTIRSFGRKSRDYFKARGVTTEATVGVGPKEYLGEVATLAALLTEGFTSGTYDEVYLAYNHYKSTLAQIPTVTRVLPLSIDTTTVVAGPDYVYEPAGEGILATLLPLYLRTLLLQAFLETDAGYQAAQMTAMDSATRNASDLIDRLTLEYNRSRQAAITKELIEIISGAEAL
jgi:F-type H+-transporting ATPase subunit gamma